jgi:hypothetical protein
MGDYAYAKNIGSSFFGLCHYCLAFYLGAALSRIWKQVDTTTCALRTA